MMTSGCSATCTGTARPMQEEQEDRLVQLELDLGQRIGRQRRNQDAQRHLHQDHQQAVLEVNREVAGLPRLDEILPLEGLGPAEDAVVAKRSPWLRSEVSSTETSGSSQISESRIMPLRV
jgi:hypothetical protein